jgi:hypothetical protein
MKFKEWLNNNGELFWEMGNIAAMDTSQIQLLPLNDPNEEFDEDDAYTDCDDEIDKKWTYQDSEYDVYDDPEDDPQFYGQSIEDWEDENPQPNEDDYTYGENDKSIQDEPTIEDYDDPEVFEKEKAEWEEKKAEYENDIENWESEREDAENDYQSEIASWEDDMKRKREKYEEAENEARSEAVYQCVETKREQWKKEREKIGEGFKTKFGLMTPQGVQEFEVIMEKTSLSHENYNINNAYNIEFHGPDGVASTGKAGLMATTIYTKLLLSVKKLLETQPVDALTFSAYEPAMNLVYNRFYKQFLQKTFLRVGGGAYIRKEFMKKTLQTVPSDKKQELFKKILDNNRADLGEIKGIRDRKNDERNIKLNLPKMVNQFVIYKGQFPALITQTDIRGNVHVIISDKNDYLYDDSAAVSDFTSLPEYLAGKLQSWQQPNDFQMKWFLQRLLARPDFLAKIDRLNLPLQQWLQKFNLVRKPQPEMNHG